MNKITMLKMAAACGMLMVCGTGCMTKASNDLSPKTAFSIKESPKNKEIVGEFPKDMNIGYAQYLRDTNGTVSLTLTNVMSAMNPDVIKESGAAQTAAFHAIAESTKQNTALIMELMKRGAIPSPVP